MEFTIHHQMLLSVFAVAAVMGAVANKTNFCTMGAVSDWVNMDDKGRLRSWLLAVAVAMGGVLLLEAFGLINLSTIFPPYRTTNFAWLRYFLGGLLFGVGMTLASGCGNKVMVRIGGGNLKSIVVLIIAATMAYLMNWTGFYAKAFGSWMSPLAIDLGTTIGAKSQTLGGIIGALLGMDDTAMLHLILGGVVVTAMLAFIFSSLEFRQHRDNILGGVVMGLAVVAGWYLTGSAIGVEWKEWAEMADTPPARVAVQSFTFIGPMGDTVRYLMNPTDLSLISFGIVALVGVVAGSFLYAMISRSFRTEWFISVGDFVQHAIGAVLMGIGGSLAMGCTIGQGVTGFSTLAVGSMLTFASIIAGVAATMKYQYWQMMREA